MRPKTLLLLVVAIACGLVAAFMVNQISGGSKAANTVDVLVPTKDIPPGTKIDVKTMFQPKPFPKDAVPLKAVTDPKELHGKVPARTLNANLPVMARDLAGNANILRELQPGYRAMTVRANIESGLHGFLTPGSRVDILTVVRDRDNSNQTESKIFLQNVMVLAVNTLSDMPENKATVGNVASITLMLRPEQVERMYLVTNRGNIGIALRKPGDTEKVETRGASSPFAEEDVGLPGGPGGAQPIQVAVAIRDIDGGRSIDRFDDYFKMMSFMPNQLIGKERLITDKTQVEGKPVTRFIAMGQPATQANFMALGEKLPVGELASHRLTIINGLRTETHDFGVGDPRSKLPPGKRETAPPPAPGQAPGQPPETPGGGGSESRD